MGLFFAAVLFFLFFYSRLLIPTRPFELMLSIALYYFSFRMLKDAITKEHHEDELHYATEHKRYRYGYISLVGLESIENSSALAALTFVDLGGALVGAAVSVSIFVVLAIKSRSMLGKIPINKLRLVSGILLALTATPLLIYASGSPAPGWIHWIIPPFNNETAR